VEERYYKVKEVALAFNVDERVVREWIAAGDLQAVNIGTGRKLEYRIPANSLTDFIASRTTGQAKEKRTDSLRCTTEPLDGLRWSRRILGCWLINEARPAQRGSGRVRWQVAQR